MSESDITFSNPHPASGEEITINVTVHNNGDADAGEFVVYFAASGSPDGINWTIPAPPDCVTVPHLSAGSSTVVSINITVLGGVYNFMVRVNYKNQIQESNEANNETSRLLEMS